MPYYKEQRAARHEPSSFQSLPRLIVRESSQATTFRSKPSDLNLTSAEVINPVTVDPYAYFLDRTSRKKYQARLGERGLLSQGEPDRGHAFELLKHTISGPGVDFTRFNKTSGVTDTYKNVLVYPVPSSGDRLNEVHDGFIDSASSYVEDGGLSTFAQQAYNRTAPTAVVFDAAQFLGELRKGLLELAPTGAATFKEFIGAKYLGWEYGWKPTILDAQNFGKALGLATQQLASEGKRVHRSYRLPDAYRTGARTGTASPQVLSGTFGVLDSAARNKLPIAPLSSSFQAGTASYDLHKSWVRRRWFEGEFTSFYPLGFDPTNYFDRLDQLIKVKPTASTAYQLTAFSWLVDWWLHLEDTIAANEKVANDLLVMHYGYAMEETISTTVLSYKTTVKPGTAALTYTNFPDRGEYVGRTMRKRRLRANPYGFRVGGGDALSVGQLAILGALGLTKLK